MGEIGTSSRDIRPASEDKTEPPRGLVDLLDSHLAAINAI